MSLKTPVSSYSEPQTSSAIELSTPYVPYIIEIKQNNYVLYSQNTIQNDATITNNDDIQSFETAKKHNYSIPTISKTDHHSEHIATTFSCKLNFNTPTILPTVGK